MSASTLGQPIVPTLSISSGSIIFQPLFRTHKDKTEVLEEARGIFSKPRNEQLDLISEFCMDFASHCQGINNCTSTYFQLKARAIASWMVRPIDSKGIWDLNKELSQDVQSIIRRDFGGLIKDIETHG